MAEVRIKPGSLTVEVWDGKAMLGKVHVPDPGPDLSNNEVRVIGQKGGPWKAKVKEQDVVIDREKD